MVSSTQYGKFEFSLNYSILFTTPIWPNGAGDLDLPSTSLILLTANFFVNRGRDQASRSRFSGSNFHLDRDLYCIVLKFAQCPNFPITCILCRVIIYPK